MEDEGDLALGVYDDKDKTIYVAKRFLPLGESDDAFNGCINGFRQLGMEILRIEFYGADGG